jgi:hypothetical protein
MQKLFIMKPILLIFATAALMAPPLPGQIQGSIQKQLKCDQDRWGGREFRSCRIVEEEIGSLGRIVVDAGRNGGISIIGWKETKTLVRAKIEANASTQQEADQLAKQVSSKIDNGQIQPAGPQTRTPNASWSVSYEIFVPIATDLKLKASNGGISIRSVRGSSDFKTQNGGVYLSGMAGNVTGETVNGGLMIQLDGKRFEGGQFAVKTQNGGITLNVPSNYDGQIHAQTVNGSVRSDFPKRANSEGMAREVELNTASSGTRVEVSTMNGGVIVKKY